MAPSTPVRRLSVMQSRPADERREELVALYHEASGCLRCPLHQTRTKVVFGSGNADADLMFVGEAPGQQEDLQGLPFVGRAGKLLDQLIEEIGLARGDVFVANVIKCRPPGNRDPQPEEIETCRPYLHRQVELIEPKRHLHAGELRHQAADPLQAGASPVSTGARRCMSSARARSGAAALSPGRRIALAPGPSVSCARTSPPSRPCSRSRCPCRSERWRPWPPRRRRRPSHRK